MQFDTLTIANWRQFENIDLKFHPKMTIITGINGAGKTTILNFLSRTLGWQIQVMSVPNEIKKDIYTSSSDLELPFEASPNPQGQILLSSGQTFNLDIKYEMPLSSSFGPTKGAEGVYVTSHRQLFSYGKLENIPVAKLSANELLSTYTSRLKNSFIPKNQEVVGAKDQQSFKLKEALISLATFGDGNSFVEGIKSYKDIFSGFSECLRTILPEELGFERFYVKIPDVFVISRSGVFPLEAVSGGISAVIDLSWQIFLASKCYDDFSVLIDEPENHLHPELQKTLLEKLSKTFPHAQFIVATHSPLMVNSVENSKVYALSRRPRHGIESSELDFFEKSASSQEILLNVLGVDGSTPQWASQKIKSILDSYRGRLKTLDDLEELRKELERQGIEGMLTEVLQYLEGGAK